MKNKYLIYIHTNKINGKVYIGQTCQKPIHRWGLQGRGYMECPHFWNAIKKYGWESFDHTIQADHQSRDEACVLEIRLISQYRSTDPQYGYNISRGGDGFDSETAKSLWQEESFRKLACERMREAWKDPEKRKLRAEQAKRRWADPSFKLRAKQKLIHSCARRVECVDTGVVYETIHEAAKAHKVSPANIVRSCKTHYRCGGFHWKYIDDTP